MAGSGRAFARAIAALLGYFAVVAAVAEGLGFIVPKSIGTGIVGTIALLALRLVAGALVANLLWSVAGWRSWKEMGWPTLGLSARGFGVGLCLGVGMAVAALTLAVVVGGARFSLTGEPMREYAAVATGLVVALTIAALSEELLFRGFPLSRLAEAIGPVGASLLLALGFAALHQFNPGVTPLALVNVAVASLLLSAVFLRLGGIPAAWGAHLGWNAGLGAVADAPVSGLSFHLPGIEYSPGSAWITGGGFGPEGGLVGTLVMVAVTVWLARGVPPRFPSPVEPAPPAPSAVEGTQSDAKGRGRGAGGEVKEGSGIEGQGPGFWNQGSA